MNDHVITTPVPGTNYVAVGTSPAPGTNYRQLVTSAGGASCCCGGCATVRKYEACDGQRNVECLATGPIWICENRRCNREDTEPPRLILIERCSVIGDGLQCGRVCYQRTDVTKPIGDLTPEDEFREFSTDLRGCQTNGTCAQCPDDNPPCDDTYIRVDPCPNQTDSSGQPLPPVLVPIEELDRPGACDCAVPNTPIGGCYVFNKSGQRYKFPRNSTPPGWRIVRGWPTSNCGTTCCDCLIGCSAQSGVVQVLSNCYAPGPGTCEYNGTRNCCCDEEGTGRWSSSGVATYFQPNFNGACDVSERITWNWSVFYTRFRDSGSNIVENVTPSTLTFKKETFAFLDGNATRSTLVSTDITTLQAAGGPFCYSPSFGPAPGISIGNIQVQGFNCPCNLDVARLRNLAGDPNADTHTWSHTQFTECHSGRQTGSATWKQGANAFNPCQYSAIGSWDAQWSFTPSGRCRGGCGQGLSAADRKRLDIGTNTRLIVSSSEVVAANGGEIITGGCWSCGNGGLVLPGFVP